MSKDTPWFRHDANARRDPRCVRLRGRYGAEGYGWFWMIVEILREQPGYSLASADIEEVLPLELNAPAEKVTRFMADCFGWGLFEREGDQWHAPSLSRRMQALEQRKQALSEAGRRGAQARLKPGPKPAQAEGKPGPKEAEARLKPQASTCQANRSDLNRSDLSREDRTADAVRAAASLPLPDILAESDTCKAALLCLVRYWQGKGRPIDPLSWEAVSAELHSEGCTPQRFCEAVAYTLQRGYENRLLAPRLRADQKPRVTNTDRFEFLDSVINGGAYDERGSGEVIEADFSLVDELPTGRA